MKQSGDLSHLTVVLTPKILAPPHVPARWTPLVSNQSGLSKAVVVAVAIVALSLIADDSLRDFALQTDPTVKSVLRHITEIGNSAWPLGIGGLLWVVLALMVRQRRGLARTVLLRAQACVLFMIASVALSGALANILKQVIGRARPMTDGGAEVYQFQLLAFDSAWASFPSGHATTAMAMMVALAMILPRHALACIAIGLLGAVTRVQLGVHWASDVAAGITLGVAVTIVLRKRIDAGRRRALMPRGATRLLRRCLATLVRNILKHPIQLFVVVLKKLR
jgi:membrane-associated phospholipid phosphatase